MGNSSKRTDYKLSREVAVRLDRAGLNPYSSDCEEYLVLADQREGEVIEFGRPLRAHRMFPVKSRAKKEHLANEFEAFAASANSKNWCFWTVHRPSKKSNIHELAIDLKQFNAELNNVFTQLRKHCRFELLMLGVHVAFDNTTRLFDLHAHFVCDIETVEDREEARRRLMTAFSRAHTPDGPIRSAQGVSRYISRSFKLKDVLKWPIEALKAAWSLIDYRFHYTRTAGSFADWRRDNKPEIDQHDLAEKRRKKENRKATRYQPEDRPERDKLLVTRTWLIGNEKIRGTLYRAAAAVPRNAPMATPPATVKSPVAAANDNQPPNYPSAIVATTQTATIAPANLPALSATTAIPSSTRSPPATATFAGWVKRCLVLVKYSVGTVRSRWLSWLRRLRSATGPPVP